MRNNNSAVIRRLTRGSFASHKVRNAFVISAIALTTLLIVTLFSIGMSVIESNQMQMTRFVGTTAHSSFNYPTDEQMSKLASLRYISDYGMEVTVAKTDNPSLILHWFDEEQWQKFRLPTVSGFTGAYPVARNEVMATDTALNLLGIEDPEIGMEIPVKYHFEDDVPKEEMFVLTGFYEDYMTARSGGLTYLAVSEELMKESGQTTGQMFVSVTYTDNRDNAAMNNLLAEDLALNDNQEVEGWVPASGGGNMDVSIFLFVIFIILAGYLMIYNVLNISVSNDIRFFGLLKTIGTTPKQIRKLVTGQAVLLSYIGIPIGLIIGLAISYLIVPFALSIVAYLETPPVVSLDPLIYGGAAFFAFATALTAALVPAKRASKMSPISALRYTASDTNKKEGRPTARGKLHVMAWRNVFRDRKRVVIVLLSLFLGVSVFMVTNTVVSAMDFNNMLDAVYTSDFSIDTYEVLHDPKDFGSEIPPDAISELKSLEGMQGMVTFAATPYSMEYDDRFSAHLDEYMRSFGQYRDQTPESVKADFSGYIFGIETSAVEALNAEEGAAIDIAAFERGEICLLQAAEGKGAEYYAGINELDIDITYMNRKLQLPVGGYMERYASNSNGAPGIYVSDSFLKSVAPNAPVVRLGFNMDDAYEPAAQEKISALFRNGPQVMIMSRLGMQQEMAGVRTVGTILGTGLSVILGMIGILNFVNTMVTSVMTRRRELAALESIGMTRSQIKKMLRYEGLGYALLSTLLIVTLGSGVCCAAFSIFKTVAIFAVFVYPTVQILIAITLITAACVATPMIVVSMINKYPVVERLRVAE